MPLACLLIRRGSLSDRALRPWPEAAVLLISLLRCVPFFASDNRSKQRGAFSPRVNVPRFAAIARPPFVCSLPTTLLGGLLCQLMLIASVAARVCLAVQPCWRY